MRKCGVLSSYLVFRMELLKLYTEIVTDKSDMVPTVCSRYCSEKQMKEQGWLVIVGVVGWVFGSPLGWLSTLYMYFIFVEFETGIFPKSPLCVKDLAASLWSY